MIWFNLDHVVEVQDTGWLGIRIWSKLHIVLGRLSDLKARFMVFRIAVNITCKGRLSHAVYDPSRCKVECRITLVLGELPSYPQLIAAVLLFEKI